MLAYGLPKSSIYVVSLQVLSQELLAVQIFVMLTLLQNKKLELDNDLTLPNYKILNMTKLKAVADDKLNVAKVMVSVLDRVENSVGKGENAGY